MAACDWLWPYGLRPYKHWKNIHPKLHTSTFEEIFGGLGPCTNTSGGRYLERRKEKWSFSESLADLTNRFRLLARLNPFHVQDHRYLRTFVCLNRNRWFWSLHYLSQSPGGYSPVSNRNESQAVWYQYWDTEGHWRFASPPNGLLSLEWFYVVSRRNRYRCLRCTPKPCRIYGRANEYCERDSTRFSYESVSISKTSYNRTIRGWSNVFRMSHSRRACLDDREINMTTKRDKTLLDVIRFLFFFPFFIQLMDLHRHVPLFFQAEGLEGEETFFRLHWQVWAYLMHFAETTFTNQTEEKITLVEDRMILKSKLEMQTSLMCLFFESIL